MVKKINFLGFIFPLLFFLVLGCEDGNKYTYIEVFNHKAASGDSVKKYKAGELIYRPTDSAAYLDAFVKYCISIRAYEQFDSLREPLLFRPIGFLLLNKNGVDITNSVSFSNKDSLERQIEHAMRDIPLP